MSSASSSSSSSGSEIMPTCEVAGCNERLEEPWFTPCCHAPLCETHQGTLMNTMCQVSGCSDDDDMCDLCLGRNGCSAAGYRLCRHCHVYWCRRRHFKGHVCDRRE